MIQINKIIRINYLYFILFMFLMNNKFSWFIIKVFKIKINKNKLMRDKNMEILQIKTLNNAF